MLFKDITLVDENYDVKQHQYVQTEGCKIVYIGDTAPEGYEGEVYDGRNKVAVPGFFDIHCHVPMTLLRGYGEGLPLDRWLNEKMFPFEAKLTAQDCYWGAMLGACELIRSGTASFTDMYFNLADISRAVMESGLKVNIARGISEMSGKVHLRDLEGYRDTDDLYRQVKASGCDRIRVDVGLHAEYTSTEGLVREVADYMRTTDMNVHVHLSETKKEHDACKERYGVTPAELFARCGLFDHPATAAHCVWIEDQDFDILRDKGVTVAHNPSSNLKLGSGFAPIKRMLEHGIRVGIGTDGAASNNNLNMLEEVTLASLVNKGASGDPTFLAPKQLLELACRNGALSQGRTDCGAIKVGNRADIVVYDLDKPHLQPVFDALANVIYAAQASDICLNMIDGDVVYRDGVLTHIDEEKVMAEAVRCKERILSEL